MEILTLNNLEGTDCLEGVLETKWMNSDKRWDGVIA